ncbi:MAG TPA: hypothetical protein VNE38_20565 [Ktedonobacteraceae bacterium]|nr:hypothetical protein [Ktedonobacteraceae bacterium]
MRNEIVRHIAWKVGVRLSQARDDNLAQAHLLEAAKPVLFISSASNSPGHGPR